MVSSRRDDDDEEGGVAVAVVVVVFEESAGLMDWEYPETRESNTAVSQFYGVYYTWRAKNHFSGEKKNLSGRRGSRYGESTIKNSYPPELHKWLFSKEAHFLDLMLTNCTQSAVQVRNSDSLSAGLAQSTYEYLPRVSRSFVHPRVANQPLP